MRCRISLEEAVERSKLEGEESGEDGGAKSLGVGVVPLEEDEEVEELLEPPKMPMLMGDLCDAMVAAEGVDGSG